MDFCIPEVPLDNSLQKDRLKLVNKGSLSKRRKPSRYERKTPVITETTNLGRHITTLQIPAAIATSTPAVKNGNSNGSKREQRRRAHSESRLNESGVVPAETKRTAEVKKNAVLIQTWERRSQSSHESNALESGKKQAAHTVSVSAKSAGKENRQSWKPVHNMPDPFTLCTNEKERLRTKNGGYNGAIHATGVKKEAFPSNRLIRPKSLCAINGSCNEEPEWISLSRKLCAKFVQSHLDTDSSVSVGVQKKVIPGPVKTHTEQNKKEQAKIISNARLSRLSRSSDASGAPPWIDLSRKLCNKFLEEHIESEQRDVDIPRNVPRSKPVDEIKRIPENLNKKYHEDVSAKTKVEPEWVNLSRRLRAKFIEGHRDDPDTISLDNQLNASDLEDYCLDTKYNSKIDHPEKALPSHANSDSARIKDGSRSTLTHEKDFETKDKNYNNTSKVSFGYWADIKPCEKNIGRTDSRDTNINHQISSNMVNGTTKYSSKVNTTQKESNSQDNAYYHNRFMSNSTSHYNNNENEKNGKSGGNSPVNHSSSNSNSYRGRSSAELDSDKFFAHDESVSKSYNTEESSVLQNYRPFVKEENHGRRPRSYSDDGDDVNYELTFEAFETPDCVEENGFVEESCSQTNEDRKLTNNLMQSKSLCDISHFEPDSLECAFELKKEEFGSTASFSNPIIYPKDEPRMHKSVTVSDIMQHSMEGDHFYNNHSEAQKTTKSKITIECRDANGFHEKASTSVMNNNGMTDLVETVKRRVEVCSVSAENNMKITKSKSSREEMHSDFSSQKASSNKKINSEGTCRTSNDSKQSLQYNEVSSYGYDSDDDFLTKTATEKCSNKPLKLENPVKNSGRKTEYFSQNEFLDSREKNGFSVKDCHSQRFYVSSVPEMDPDFAVNDKPIQCDATKSKSSTLYFQENGDSGVVKSKLIDSRSLNDKNQKLQDKKELKQMIAKRNSNCNGISNGKSMPSLDEPNYSEEVDSHVKYAYHSKHEYRSVELMESNPGNKKSAISERINGKRESLKEFDVANESYQAINPPFEFDAFELPSICSPENKRILEQHEDIQRVPNDDYYERKRVESSDSETPNSTPFDARTLVSPSSCASDSETSSWTLTKNNSYGRNPSSLRDTDFSDCSLSVRCNDTPTCSNQSTMESRSSLRPEMVQVPKKKNKNPADRFSEVFVDCETTMNWKKTRSLDHLEEKSPASNTSNVYANIQPESEKANMSKSNGNIDSTSSMPESLRHLFNIPRTHIYTPTAKTSLLLSKSSEPLPCHYYSNTPLSVPPSKSETNFSSKPKTERSSSIKIKDIAHGIILTFRKFHSHSKSSQLSSSQYVDVSHLAESSTSNVELGVAKHLVQSNRNVQSLSSTEYGKINSRISAGYFGHRSTSESNLFYPSTSQLCTCKEPPSKTSKHSEKEERPKSFNFGMITEAKKNKANKKTPEMKEKKTKNHHGKNRNKKLEHKPPSSVSRKVQQMADGTLCLVTTVSGDTAVPGVYSDSQDTSSEISSHAPVKHTGESNC